MDPLEADPPRSIDLRPYGARRKFFRGDVDDATRRHVVERHSRFGLCLPAEQPSNPVQEALVLTCSGL